jgi:hypothetical protein
MKVTKSTIPTDSLTRNYLPADYTGVFVCEVNSAKEISPDDVMVRFWTDSPGWTNVLFKIRNFLMSFAGLKSSENDNLKEFENCIRTGGHFGLASIPAKNNNETVWLLTDKHLDAYMSVFIEKNKERRTISAITLVHFKNKFGHVYFFFIRFFTD